MIVLGSDDFSNDIFPTHSSTTLSLSRHGPELAHVLSLGARSHLSHHATLIFKLLKLLFVSLGDY